MRRARAARHTSPVEVGWRDPSPDEATGDPDSMSTMADAASARSRRVRVCPADAASFCPLPSGAVGSGAGRRMDYASSVRRSDSSTCGMIWYTFPQPSVITKSPSRATVAV